MVVSPPDDLGQDVEPFLGGLEDLGGVDAQLCQQGADDLLVGVQQRGQQVHRLEPLVAAVACQGLGLLDGFLALECELIETKGHGHLTGMAVAGRGSIQLIADQRSNVSTSGSDRPEGMASRGKRCPRRCSPTRLDADRCHRARVTSSLRTRRR